jgi:ribosome-associated translation inhibitor RaiA
MRVSIDRAFDHIERQIRKQEEKLQDHRLEKRRVEDERAGGVKA